MWENNGYERLEVQKDMLNERARKMQKEAATQKALKDAKKQRAALETREATVPRGKGASPVLRFARFVAGLF